MSPMPFGYQSISDAFSHELYRIHQRALSPMPFGYQSISDSEDYYAAVLAEYVSNAFRLSVHFGPISSFMPLSLTLVCLQCLSAISPFRTHASVNVLAGFYRSPMPFGYQSISD